MPTAVSLPERTSIHLSSSPVGEVVPSNPPSNTSNTQRRPSSTLTANTNGSRPKMGKERSLNTHYDGPVIPESTKQRRKHRTIVLCFDGTGDQFDNDNSNVVQFFALLKKGEPKQQLVYYQVCAKCVRVPCITAELTYSIKAGIGTYTVPQIATPIRSKIAKTVDMMIGSSLHHHVMGGYEFTMENCKSVSLSSDSAIQLHTVPFLDREGDRICILGFSRYAVI